ncbi:hypothetical protein PENANT_c049G02942 [Penicillium antarcticum]|uniref:Xylanolytic transcriptional activator regulatory domain-containing protein n=1 Tax=Penicillium antarcticum TaxID=416450 RepID=A0A1V6PR91_9EURO|nr:uncharacterized protein N7508_003728 [Penicillium antarcticum]KAJ5312898.1 hypothetical protein N7508_003728 [Penicillium antarcticum]OQD79524.1 hypothetical protein PENANT_c049G02942 [Penicillium antarcticum]
MELTWLPDIPQSRSRTRALRACPQCQRSKKRCRHLNPEGEPFNNNVSISRNLSKPNDIAARTTRRDGSNRCRPYSTASIDRPRAASDGPSLSAPTAERFVGDLNPESVIRERLDETGNPLRDRIGLWISSPAAQKSKAERLRGTLTDEDSTSISSITAKGSEAAVASLHERFAAGLQACERLPLATKEPLAAIYFSKVNHIVPILDHDLFVRSQTDGSSSVFLEKAICLTAAKTHGARSYLRLVPKGPVLSSRQFCSEIYNELVVAMDAGLESDRLTRIRVLALMSFHCEGYEGAEAASLYLCQAIHQAQTVGLHLGRPNQTSTDPLTKLFWCLWTLDKMHASIGGRPVLLADRDIGVVKPDVNAQRSRGAFEVWLAVSDLLATVISYYRPSADPSSGWEEGFPAFEDIVGEDAQEDLDYATLGFLELYYHSVAILSCRHKLAENIDGTRLSTVRQGLSAVRIHSIVASECADDLPPLPIVPYSISLSMGVSYRQLRSSRLITHLDRAKASLEACCCLLENLSPYWYSAEAMGRLGHKALQQIGSQPQPSSRDTMQQRQKIESAPKPTTASTAVAEGLEQVNFVPSGNEQNQARAHQPTYDLPVDPSAPETGIEILQPQLGELDGSSLQDGFADIDMLFGEFLDLSLPTNFWDPIFMEQGQTGEEGQTG